MCVLLHLLICTALRVHIIVVEVLYKINYYYYYYDLPILLAPIAGEKRNIFLICLFYFLQQLERRGIYFYSACFTCSNSCRKEKHIFAPPILLTPLAGEKRNTFLICLFYLLQ